MCSGAAGGASFLSLAERQYPGRVTPFSVINPLGTLIGQRTNSLCFPPRCPLPQFQSVDPPGNGLRVCLPWFVNSGECLTGRTYTPTPPPSDLILLKASLLSTVLWRRPATLACRQSSVQNNTRSSYFFKSLNAAVWSLNHGPVCRDSLLLLQGELSPMGKLLWLMLLD